MFRRFLLSALIAVVSVSALAQGSAKEILTSIQQIRTTEFAAAREAKRMPDLAGVEAKVKAKAEESIKGVDAAKIDAKDAFEWAQVFQMAGRNKEACDLMHKFLTTDPPADRRFDAQMIMMTSCNALGEADMLVSTLKDIRPVTPSNSSSLANVTATVYADTIAKQKSRADAIATLDALQKSLPQPDFEAQAKAMLQADRVRRTSTPAPPPDNRSDEEKLQSFLKAAHNQFDSARLSLVKKQAELLMADGKKDAAIRVLDDFGKTLDSTSTTYRQVNLTKTNFTLPNSPAPAIAIERGYGSFPGLAEMKGKVVVMDFFAHWCGPCKAAFPDMRQMLADLQDKGLVMVGVTTYYGYYKQERNMSKDDEFAHMKEFIAENNLTWPVVYGDKSNFDAYGVQFIPHVVLVDRRGVVRDLHVGYSKETFSKFRKEVEALLAEK